MNLFIIEKKGRKLDGKTTRRSIPAVPRRNKRARRCFSCGDRRGGLEMHVAIVTALSLSPLSAVSVGRSVVCMGSAKSQQDQNLPWKSTAALLNQRQLAEEVFFFFLNRATSQKTSQLSIFYSS